MKKIIAILTLTFAISACRKTELPVQTEKEVASIAASNKGGNNPPEITTGPITNKSFFGATIGFTISIKNNGDLNTILERGVCVSTNENPTTADQKTSKGPGSLIFSLFVSPLSPGTTYHTRAYLIRKAGNTEETIYGDDISFTTDNLVYGTVTDYDGNVYTTIQIGSQTWTVENLKTTHYRDGFSIPNVTDNAAWAALSTGAYCNYNNDGANVDTYGRLYNWYAVNDAHNLAPAGWHVPSYTEWYETLMNYLGGCSAAGRRLKDDILWNGDNSSGFKGLPAGYRSSLGSFSAINSQARWRLSTVSLSNPESAWYVEQDSGDGSCGISGSYNPKYGYSIRLVKD